MKKILVIASIIMLSLQAHSQSVMGINFGSSEDEVYQALETRFNSYEINKSAGKIELLLEFNIGDVNFRYGSFEFQRRGKESYFNYAHLEKHYTLNNVQNAIIERDYIRDVIYSKYKEIRGYKNSQGYYCYHFGTDPKNENRYLGEITLSKLKGNDGKVRLYLFLDYGPIYYIDKNSDF